MNRAARSIYRSTQSGFTLVELLVVVAIIAILASVVIAGVSSALNAAKRVRASNMADGLQTALNAYYTEYSVYPVVPGGAATDTYFSDSDEDHQATLMYALCGNVNPANPQAAPTPGAVPNARQIAFMTPRRSDIDANGVPLNPFNPTANQYFNIAMDSDYSGIVGDSGGVTAKMPDFTAWKQGSTVTYLTNGTTQGVAIWCDCDPSNLGANETSSKAPNFWVHTY